MNQLTFGIPKQRSAKVEKYPDRAVLTIGPIPSKEGEHYRFELNKKAVQQLELNLTGDEQISFAFNNSDMFIKVSTTDETIQESDKLRVTKTGTFSSRKLYEYLNKAHNTQHDDEYELLSAFDNVFQLNIITAGELASAEYTVEEVVEVPVPMIEEDSPVDEDPFATPLPPEVNINEFS